MTRMRTISLPEELCQRAEKKFGGRFSTLGDLLTATLTELLQDDAVLLDEREQKIIEERLKGLGYI